MACAVSLWTYTSAPERHTSEGNNDFTTETNCLRRRRTYISKTFPFHRATIPTISCVFLVTICSPVLFEIALVGWQPPGALQAAEVVKRMHPAVADSKCRIIVDAGICSGNSLISTLPGKSNPHVARTVERRRLHGNGMEREHVHKSPLVYSPYYSWLSMKLP